ncbi:MAG: DUF6273 domain-containing protein [Bacilli bacterium]
MAKKKLLFFSIFIIIILVFVLTIYNIIYKNNNIYLNNKDEAPNFISIMLEETASSGEYKVSKSNKWPSKGYVFNKEMSYCNNGSTLTWNENDNSVSVNINKTDKCYVYFDIYVPTLVEYVKSQYTGTQGENGLYYHDSTLANGAGDNSYRYAGASDSVNNYICLGSDTTTCPDANLFRIIGVFGDKTKVIRAKSVGNQKWHTSESNTWSSSSLNAYLNGTYLTSLGTIAEKIATTTWKVGGCSWSNIETSVPKIVYKNEVGSSASTTTVDKKIGLMYISDYYYSASPSAWTLVGYNKSDATKDYSAAKTINWLYLGSKEWTISRVSDETFSAFIVDGSGHVFSYNVNFSNFAVRPSFNLDSTVTYVSGDGTKSNPIRIN